MDNMGLFLNRGRDVSGACMGHEGMACLSQQRKVPSQQSHSIYSTRSKVSWNLNRNFPYKKAYTIGHVVIRWTYQILTVLTQIMNAYFSNITFKLTPSRSLANSTSCRSNSTSLRRRESWPLRSQSPATTLDQASACPRRFAHHLPSLLVWVWPNMATVFCR